jgi:hypothetical protein
MSLEFAIIPTTTKFFSTAHDIKDKLTNNIRFKLDIQIDTDTDTRTQTRIQKWKKQGYNVVFIDEDYNESNSIIVTFSEKGSRPQSMLVDEFIDIVSSYEPNDDDNNETNETNETDENNSEIKEEDDNQDGGCIIM